MGFRVRFQGSGPQAHRVSAALNGHAPAQRLISGFVQHSRIYVVEALRTGADPLFTLVSSFVFQFAGTGS